MWAKVKSRLLVITKNKEKKGEFMNRIVNDLIKYFGIMAIITFTWQVLEVFMLGEIIASRVDSIIGIILTLSLYYNLESWNKVSSESISSGINNLK